MLAYVLRRLGIMVVILLGSSFILYNLSAISADPLEGLRNSTEENAQFQLRALTRELQLDVPPPIRYFLWLKGILGFFIGEGTLGKTFIGGSVGEALAGAIPTTIRLVLIATITAIVLGIGIGIVSALRQYSRFDYSMTFASFLMFSLPIFWVAVLLKQFLAIDFNNFLANPTISPPWIVGVSVFAGIFWAGVLSGDRVRVVKIFFFAALVHSLVLIFLSETEWFAYPTLGPIGLVIFGTGIALGVTFLTTGLENKATRNSTLAMVFVSLVLYFPVQVVLEWEPKILVFAGLFSATMIVSLVAPRLFSKIDRGPITRATVITAFLLGILILVDKLMQTWRPYMETDDINFRAISTIGESTIWLSEVGFWIKALDFVTHLILPTIALTLVSFAGYVRFTRGTLLEVLNQDYIRTARAKGMNERTVIMRHAFRNTMIPLTTIMVVDFAGIVGGAIITERVFGWQGMGTLFNVAIRTLDLNLLMGVFLITGTLAVTANLIADLLYSALDPRIRVGAGK